MLMSVLIVVVLCGEEMEEECVLKMSDTKDLG